MYRITTGKAAREETKKLISADIPGYSSLSSTGKILVRDILTAALLYGSGAGRPGAGDITEVRNFILSPDTIIPKINAAYNRDPEGFRECYEYSKVIKAADNKAIRKACLIIGDGLTKYAILLNGT